MFYLYLDHELIAQSEILSEILDIIFVELLHNCQLDTPALGDFIEDLIKFNRSTLYVGDGTFTDCSGWAEVYYGRNS